jgi:predicted transcriptional regulator
MPNAQACFVAENAQILAVVDDHCHVGRISAQAVLDELRTLNPRLDARIAELMGPPFPSFDETASVDDVMRVLRTGEPAVVTREGRPIATVGARELLQFATRKLSA